MFFTVIGYLSCWICILMICVLVFITDQEGTLTGTVFGVSLFLSIILFIYCPFTILI